MRPSISRSSSGVIDGKCRINRTRAQVRCFMKVVRVALSLCFLAPATISAQQHSGPTESMSPTLGVELDVLPYVTGGCYASGWIGYNHVRARLVASKLNAPDFTLKDDFTNAETRAYATLVDYFWRPSFRGA